MRWRLLAACLASMALTATPAVAITTTSRGPAVDLRHADPREVVNGETFRELPINQDAQGVLLAANGNQAVGQLVVNNTSHEILFDGRKLNDFFPQLGPGNFVSIDGFGDIAGAQNGQPLFFHAGRSALTLPLAGQANGVALGPFVGFTTRDQAGNPTAGVWNPKTGATASLGAAQVGGVNAMHMVVGRAANGDAWYAKPVTSRDFETHDLGWQGFLARVNAFGMAIGNRTIGGGPVPVGVNLNTGAITNYKLPAGFQFGSITGISDTNIAVGNLFRTAADLQANNAVGVVYTKPSHPTLFTQLHAHHMPHTSFLAFNAISPTGVAITGVLPEGTQTDVPVLLTPDEKFKLFGIGSIKEKWGSKKLRDDFVREADAIEIDLALGHRRRACASLGNLGATLGSQADFLDGLFGPSAAEYIQVLDDISDGLAELSTELHCFRSFRTLDLSPQQINGL